MVAFPITYILKPGQTANGDYSYTVDGPIVSTDNKTLTPFTTGGFSVLDVSPPHVIGTNTVVNMQSGLYFGYLGLVDGMLARIKREVPDLKTVVATGGLAALLAADSEHIEHVDDNLTLTGLKIIYDRNRGPRRGRHR